MYVRNCLIWDIMELETRGLLHSLDHLGSITYMSDSVCIGGHGDLSEVRSTDYTNRSVFVQINYTKYRLHSTQYIGT